MSKVKSRGKIISLEGGDGSGKSTAIHVLVSLLEEKGIPFMLTREPGGVPIAEKVRDIILDVNHTEMDPRTEALLYAAARRQHLAEKVLPALEEGKLILFDRYVDSSVVYQGHVRGIGMEEVYQLNLFATQGLLPDLTLWLDVTPEIGLKRIRENAREENRLDLEDIDFHQKVRQGYAHLAKEAPHRFVRIDADQDLEVVKASLVDQVEKWLVDHEA